MVYNHQERYTLVGKLIDEIKLRGHSYQTGGADLNSKYI